MDAEFPDALNHKTDMVAWLVAHTNKLLTAVTFIPCASTALRQLCVSIFDAGVLVPQTWSWCEPRRAALHASRFRWTLPDELFAAVPCARHAADHDGFMLDCVCSSVEALRRAQTLLADVRLWEDVIPALCVYQETRSPRACVPCYKILIRTIADQLIWTHEREYVRSHVDDVLHSLPLPGSRDYALWLADAVRSKLPSREQCDRYHV